MVTMYMITLKMQTEQQPRYAIFVAGILNQLEERMPMQHKDSMSVNDTCSQYLKRWATT